MNDEFDIEDLISDVIECVTDDMEKHKDFIMVCIEDEIREWDPEDLHDFLSGKMEY